MEQPHTLLTALRSDLTACIAANDAAGVDRIGRIALNALTAQACRYVRAIDSELRRGEQGIAPGLWGENGNAPAIRSIISQSERQRELGRQAAAA